MAFRRSLALLAASALLGIPGCGGDTAPAGQAAAGTGANGGTGGSVGGSSGAGAPPLAGTGGSASGTGGSSQSGAGGATSAGAAGRGGDSTAGAPGGQAGSAGADALGGAGTGATGGTSGSGGTSGDGPAGTGGVAGSGMAGTSGTAGAAGAAPDTSGELYDPTTFPRFDFDLPPASASALGAVTGPDDPKQDTYVTGTFTYDKGGKNEAVMNVGFRLKGEGSFKPFEEKPAWKVKFDEFVPDQRFHGLARMSFNNAEDDPAFIAERLAYDVYRAAGVPAPRCNSAQIYVNGAFYGVYNNTESEDKHFIARWFASNDGNLYEKNGTRDFAAASASEFELETNETANDRSDIDALIAAVVGASTPASFMTDVGTKLDVNEWIRFTAVEGLVNEWDAYSFTLWYPHNFRVYDDPSTAKFAFIPWGNDMAMQPAPVRVTDKQFIQMFALTRSQDQASGKISSGILFQRCLASAPCKTAYTQAIEAAVTVWEGLGMEARATRYYQQVKPKVLEDTRKVTENGILTNAEFEAAYQAVLGVVRGRLAAVQADLDSN